MSRVRMILLAVISVVAASAVGTSAAAAGTGTLSLDSPPCNITFDSSGAPADPASTTIFIDNVVVAGCPFTVKNPLTNIYLDLDGNGNVEANGVIATTVYSIFNCNYSINAVPGLNTATSALVSGTLTTGSGFPCPSPASYTMRMDGL
jgi:hypothetical protein